MGVLTEAAQWVANVFKIETDTVWKGGDDGDANKQGQALANRTSWLKEQVEALALAISNLFSAQDLQKATAITSNAGGTANVITATYTPAITALSNGMTLYVRAASANTTTTPTFTPNTETITAKTIVKGAGSDLAAGDIAGGGHWIELQYDMTLDKWVLLNPATCVGGSIGVVGSLRNAAMSVTAASATATLTADEVIVETSFGGTAYRIPNFNKTINLATTGAGGMDTGAAPVSGYVALYAIYNPSTKTSALLAVNATSAAQPNIYGGANMPAGYTASALVSVWATNASSQFKIGYQRDRNVFFPSVTALASSTVAGSLTSLNISGTVPQNAVAWSGSAIMVSTSTSSVAMSISADVNNTGAEYFNGSAVPGGAVSAPISTVPIITKQTTYYTSSSTAGTPTFTIYVNGYTF